MPTELPRFLVTSSNCVFVVVKVKGKAIHVTGRVGPHYLDSGLRDGGEVVSHRRGHPLPLGRFLVLIFVRD
jgi:hypothetical protein